MQASTIQFVSFQVMLPSGQITINVVDDAEIISTIKADFQELIELENQYYYWKEQMSQNHRPLVIQNKIAQQTSIISINIIRKRLKLKLFNP